MERSAGAVLALMLLRGFHAMIADVRSELALRGHADVRTADEFALRAVAEGAETTAELARRLDVTKQAAAQRVAILVRLGYVQPETDPTDARRKPLRVTPRGHEMMTIGGAVLDDVRARWAAEIGPDQLAALEAHLALLTAGADAGDSVTGVDDPLGSDGR